MWLYIIRKVHIYEVPPSCMASLIYKFTSMFIYKISNEILRQGEKIQ